MNHRPGKINISTKTTAAFLSVLLLTGDWLASNALAQANRKRQNDKADLSLSNRERVRQAIQAVGEIFVLSDGKGPFQRGSGVVVRKDGIVVTNYHVIADDRSGKLFDKILFDIPDGAAGNSSQLRRYSIAPALVSKELDLALLIISTDAAGNPVSETATFPVIELADSRKVQPLDDLTIIGFPAKGLGSVTVNTGIVEGVDLLGNWIKTNARVLHGNSGGAAVNSIGKLIGIPTKVLVDKKAIDEDGDGFPDSEREYGAVGFLRPSSFVESLLAQVGPVGTLRSKQSPSAPIAKSNQPMPDRPIKSDPAQSSLAAVPVRGIITSADSGRPVAGARVGIVRAGTTEVTADTLLTWGGTNAEGKFELNNPLPPGQYMLKVKALGFETLTRGVEIKSDQAPLTIQLRPSS